jgi:3-phosphoshikimate 1-carboxyvinyltransferase
MVNKELPRGAKSEKSECLKGKADIPGDKSISHRAVILGALTVGETIIYGLLESTDVLNTVKAMKLFGAEVNKNNDGSWSIFGVGIGGFYEPQNVINCGNSGTSVRLIMGAMATTPINATFTGDESLIKRPMKRVLDPLYLFGSTYLGRNEGLLPLTLKGASNPVPVTYESNISSAQIKSAVLLAGLNAPGTTTYFEPELSRDHTENMLKSFGAKINQEVLPDGIVTSLIGQPELVPQKVFIPKDPSSAAFLIGATLMVEGSEVMIPDVGQNKTRNGFIETLKEMGANINLENFRNLQGEIVADLVIKSSELEGVNVSSERSVSMIDEYPILAILASQAKGKTTMYGLKELRVKESDRISAISKGLQANGVKVEEGEDFLIVHGHSYGMVPGGGKVSSFMDHRIAMSFLCLGLASIKSIIVDDISSVDTSFPEFINLINNLGGRISCDF